MNISEKVKVHIKNNHASPDTFPNTPEGEEIFTISENHYQTAIADHADMAERLQVFIDWDTGYFETSMQDAQALVCWDLPTENLAEIAPQLKWIHIIGAGVEHLLPMDWVPPGVVITNNKGVHAAKAGEYGLMSILMLHNSIPAFVTDQRSADFRPVYSTPIAGKTVVIVGVGSMGGAVAVLARKLGLHVIGVSRQGRPHAGVHEMVTVEELDRVLPEADYVFVSTPLTPQTRNLIDGNRIDSLKPGCGIVNIGRAAVVDYDALVLALESGHLSGAVLDVFDPEPLPPDSKLWNTRNLIITPHVSADDGNSYVPLTLDLFLRNMRRYLEGKPLENIVRPELGY